MIFLIRTAITLPIIALMAHLLLYIKAMKSEVRNVEINNSYLYFIAVFNLM